MNSKISDLVLFSAILTLTISRPAHAYLDAGTGSIVLQALIATFVGGMFVIKLSYRKIKAFFTEFFTKKK